MKNFGQEQVLISRHPYGNKKTNGLILGAIPAILLSQEGENCRISIEITKKLSFTILSQEREILLNQTDDPFPEMLTSYQFQKVLFRRFEENDFLEGQLILENGKIFIETNIPTECLLDYTFPDLPTSITDIFNIESTNIGFPSFWRISRRCYNKSDGTPHIIKVIPKINFSREEGMELQSLLEKEATNICIGQEFVPAITDENKDYIFIIHEYADIGDCQTFANASLSVNTKKFMAKKMIESIKKMHEYGFLHNRISLDRFKIFYKEGRVQIKLFDFGYVTHIEGECLKEQDKNWGQWWLQTSQGEHSIAPERKTGMKSIKSDIYSLGMMLQELLPHELIEQMITPQVELRTSLDVILAHDYFADIDELKASEDFKTSILINFFKQQFSNYFYFSTDVSLEAQEKHIQRYLLNAVIRLSQDEASGFNVTNRSITYRDQVSEVMGWKVVINYLPLFKAINQMLIFHINDLLAEELPPYLSQYISQEKFSKLQTYIEKKVSTQKNSLTDPSLKPFSYTDLENPSQPVPILRFDEIDEGFSDFECPDVNVLSLPIKISQEVADRLTDEGRRDGQNCVFDPQKIYIPLELLSHNPDFILSVIISCLQIEIMVNKSRFLNSYTYLTNRKKIVWPTDHNALGIDGWHVDGLWGARTKFFQKTELHGPATLDRNYVIQSSEDMRTEWTPYGVDLESIKQGASEAGFDNLDAYFATHENQETSPPAPLQKLINESINEKIKAHGKEAVVHYLPPKTLAFFDATVIHRVPENTTGQPIKRSILRLAFSPDPFNKLGNSINPVTGPIFEQQFFSIDKMK